MITFKEHRNLTKNPSKEITEEDLKNLQELSPVVSQVVFELQEFIWKVLKLLGLKSSEWLKVNMRMLFLD